MIVHLADRMCTIDAITNTVKQHVMCGKELECAAHLPALGAAPWSNNLELVNCERCIESHKKAEADAVAYDIERAFRDS